MNCPKLHYESEAKADNLTIKHQNKDNHILKSIFTALNHVFSCNLTTTANWYVTGNEVKDLYVKFDVIFVRLGIGQL